MKFKEFPFKEFLALWKEKSRTSEVVQRFLEQYEPLSTVSSASVAAVQLGKMN